MGVEEARVVSRSGSDHAPVWRGVLELRDDSSQPTVGSLGPGNWTHVMVTRAVQPGRHTLAVQCRDTWSDEVTFLSAAPFNVARSAGLVPDEQTAIAMAVAVWTPIYGAEKIARGQPYHAKLVDDFWIVRGSLPAGVAGGTAVAEIARSDGRIRRVIHEQ
jgi:hypothetical protein